MTIRCLYDNMLLTLPVALTTRGWGRTRVSNRVTIADVAREASVSPMTVSRVINNRQDVSLATRQRVLQVIDRLDYRPSGIARGLATRRTGTLGLVVPDVANPFFSDLVRGVEHVAYAQGYNVFLCNTEEDPQRELTVLESLEEKRIDGLVLCSSRLDEDQLQAALARHRSVVLVNRRLESGSVCSVIVDDETGGWLATRHLLRTGHRAIAFLAGPPNSHSGRLRTKGYHAALEEMGVSLLPDWVYPCHPGVAGGQRATHDLLAAHPEATGLFCYNDLVAVGALQACAELGRTVPDDLAIVGYDDILLSALVTPALTTCQVPRYDLGGQAVQLLLEQIEGCSQDSDEIVLQPELVVRASAPYSLEEK